MDEKMRELIAIGAAYASNCEACLVYHIHKADELGIPVEEVHEAIMVGRVVKGAQIERTENLIERMFERAEQEAEKKAA